MFYFFFTLFFNYFILGEKQSFNEKSCQGRKEITSSDLEKNVYFDKYCVYINNRSNSEFCSEILQKGFKNINFILFFVRNKAITKKAGSYIFSMFQATDDRKSAK